MRAVGRGGGRFVRPEEGMWTVCTLPEPGTKGLVLAPFSRWEQRLRGLKRLARSLVGLVSEITDSEVQEGWKPGAQLVQAGPH